MRGLSHDTLRGKRRLELPNGYFRFHGRNYAQWWQHEAPEDRYNYLYTSAEQRELAKEVDEVARRTEDTYVFYPVRSDTGWSTRFEAQPGVAGAPAPILQSCAKL